MRKRNYRPATEILEDRACPSLALYGFSTVVNFFPEPAKTGTPEQITFTLEALNSPNLTSALGDIFSGSVNFGDGSPSVSFTNPNGTLILGAVGSVTGTMTSTGVENFTFIHTYPSSVANTTPPLTASLTDITAGNVTTSFSGGQLIEPGVNQSPTITSSASVTFVVGAPGSFQVTSTGNPIPNIAISGATLPTGVSFKNNGDGTGTLSGTPTGITSGHGTK